MLRLSLKGVWAHRTRLILTLLAIMLGVGLISGVYIYTDTINRSFQQIFTQAFAGLDIVVRADSDFSFGEGTYISEDDFARASAVPGIEQAFPELQALGINLLDQEGEILGGRQAVPTFAFSITEGNPTGFVISQGVYPVGPGQIALDQETAQVNDFNVGNTVSLISEHLGRFEAELVGIASLAQLDNLGSRWVMFDLPTTQMVLGLEGLVTGGGVFVTPGTSVDQVLSEMNPLLPEYAQALSGQAAAEEEAAELQQSLSFLTTFLSVFGFIALFVGAFLIYNTFRIVVTQRTRELALLRAVGASKRQVRLIVLLESLALGLLGSILGIAFGFLIAVLLQLGLGAAGLSFPRSTLNLQARTVIVGLLTGTLVTLIASISPARRASKVVVMEALSEHPTPTGRSRVAQRTLILGGIILALGLGAAWLGLFGGGGGGLNEIAWVGLGAGIIFVGMFILSPLLARPVTNFLGLIGQRVTGTAGKLARRNAMRDPRRAAATAGAVMISITLVALASTLSGSLRATINEVLANNLRADVIVSNASFFNPFAAFTTNLGDEIQALEEVEDISRLQLAPVRLYIDLENDVSSETFVYSVQPNLDPFFPADTSSGSLMPGPGEVVLSQSIASDNGWALGDPINLEFEQTGFHVFTLVGTAEGGIWDQTDIAVSREQWPTLVSDNSDSNIYVLGAAGVSPESLKAQVESLAADLPTVEVQTQEDLESQAEEGINQILNLILALLAVTVIIGMLGVTNTMALSVFERTREIGLLRAVGLDRPTTRWMVRIEAAVVSVFGCLLGIGLGILFGWAIVQALSDTGVTQFLIPWLPDSLTPTGLLGSLLFWVAKTAVLAVIFATYPARRASRLNVVDAIAHT